MTEITIEDNRVNNEGSERIVSQDVIGLAFTVNEKDQLILRITVKNGDYVCFKMLAVEEY